MTMQLMIPSPIYNGGKILKLDNSKQKLCPLCLYICYGSIDQLTLITQFVMIGFSTKSQKAKYIVMHGGIEQVATVSSMALLCCEM